jgi:hypothetical protein
MARTDRDPPETRSPYAKTSSVNEEDRALLESATGRAAPEEEGESSVQEDEIREKSVGGRPASDVTGFHTSGTGAVETDDGLDEISERARQAAEDEGIEREEAVDEPVFDRAERS